MSNDNLPISAPAAKGPVWKNLGIRFFSAVGLFLICIAPFYFGGWIWAMLVVLFGVRMLYEWVRMSDVSGSWWPYILPVIGLCVGAVYTVQGEFGLAVCTVILTGVITAFLRFRRGGMRWGGLGALYIIIPSLMMIGLRGNEVGFATAGFTKLVFIILTVVAADVGAYFGGSYFKGPKLSPKLSPNKTWSGFVSGLLFSMFVGAIAAFVIGFSPVMGATLAVPIALLSVFGDLLESGLKRRLNVKDAGGLIPGHGGLLDRLDSLMMAVVGAAIILLIFPGIWPV